MIADRVPTSIAVARLDRSTKLDLSGQNLTELPDSIGELDSLVVLDLSNNQLTRLPDSIGNLHRLTVLNIRANCLNELPETIGNLTKLEVLIVHTNPLIKLPETIGNLTQLTRLRLGGDASWISNIKLLPESLGNLVNLTYLQIDYCQLVDLPKSVTNLRRLSQLYLIGTQLTTLPPVITHLTRLIHLSLKENKLTDLPENIDRLSKLKQLDVSENQITKLPKSMGKLVNLFQLYLSGNSIIDFSILQTLPKLKHADFFVIQNLPPRYWAKFSEWKSEWILDERSHSVRYILIKQLGLDRTLTDLANIFEPHESHLDLQTAESIEGIDKLTQLKVSWMLDVNLPRRYWIKFSDWKAKWLLDEKNAEIRSRLIEHIGYERICEELGAIAIDIWQEYTLLKIDNIQIVYQGRQEVGREAMMLLKMTCPSTAHIQILRVPPDLTSAEAAIVWVNHGIHPSQFSIQT